MHSLTANPGIFVEPDLPLSWGPAYLVAAAILALLLIMAIKPSQFGRIKIILYIAAAVVSVVGMTLTFSTGSARMHEIESAQSAHQAAVADWLDTDYGVAVNAGSIPLNPGDKLVQITGELNAKPVIVGFSSNKAGDLLAFDGNAKLFTPIG